MKKRLYKFYMILLGIWLGTHLLAIDVRAEETPITPPEKTDVERIEAENAEPMPKTNELWDVDAPGYYFTKKSEGKYIPVTSTIDGTLFYRCTDLVFMNSKKKQVKSKYEFYTEGLNFYNLYDVKKNKTYYVYVPNNVDIGTICLYVYPDNVRNIKMDKTYFQTGTGKNIYKYFTLKKMALIDFRIVHATFKGKSTEYYLQKKIKGKWKRITERRTVTRHHLAEIDCYRSPYGLSKGKYRLVSKTVKNAKFWIYPETKKCVNNGKSSKRKAKRIKNGMDVEGVFTYGDKNVHWYRVKADRDICLTFKTSMEPHGVTFTIYKKGIKKPVKVIKLKGKSGRQEWEGYKKSKKYTLEDGDGLYYIKVSRKHARANGWYAIEN